VINTKKSKSKNHPDGWFFDFLVKSYDHVSCSVDIDVDWG